MNSSNGVDYLIIGGGIAGVTAAETIREHDKSGSIAIVSMEPHLLYSRVLLPSYLKQRIKREQVFMRRIADFDKSDIGFLAGEEVTAVGARGHEVTLSSGTIVRCRKLLVAAGGRVAPVTYEGARGLQEIYRLQTIEDADRLYPALPNIKEAVVVGGGFIALEFLEILQLRGIRTTLLCRDEHFGARLMSKAGSQMIEGNFEEHGIRILMGEDVASVLGQDGYLRGVVTARGKELRADGLFVGVGLLRNIEFLQGFGISLGKKGILADAYLRTNVSDVFVAGDIAEFEDVALGMTHTVGNWNNAFLQGKAVGRTMAGKDTQFINLPSYSISNLGFHWTVVGNPDLSLPSVIREQRTPPQYLEFFLRDGLLMGAVIINLPRAQSVLQRWILERRNLSGKEGLLADIKVALETIV